MRWFGTLKLMSVIALLWASFSLGLSDFLWRCMKPKDACCLLEAVDMKGGGGCYDRCLSCMMRSMTSVQELPPLPLPLTWKGITTVGCTFFAAFINSSLYFLGFFFSFSLASLAACDSLFFDFFASCFSRGYLSLPLTADLLNMSSKRLRAPRISP